MSKIKLELQDLAVDSFTTGEVPGPRGTVRGQAPRTQFLGCVPQDTLYHSCGWSDETNCDTQGCLTDFQTCGAFGSCCPAECN